MDRWAAICGHLYSSWLYGMCVYGDQVTGHRTSGQTCTPPTLTRSSINVPPKSYDYDSPSLTRVLLLGTPTDGTACIRVVDDQGNMDDALASDAARGPVVMDEDATEADAEYEDTDVRDSHRTSRSSSSAASTTSTPPQSSTTESKQAEIDVLQAENAFLRLALEEAEAKLKAASNLGRSVRPVRSRSISSASKEPGNGGVAYAQMRRLLLKDERFLRDTFLPFLNVQDFGR